VSLEASVIPVLLPFRSGSLLFTDARSLSRQDRADMRRVSRAHFEALLEDPARATTELCYGMDANRLANNGVNPELEVLHFQVLLGEPPQGLLLGDLSFYNVEVTEKAPEPTSRQTRNLLLRGCPAPAVAPWPGADGRRRMFIAVLSATLDTPLWGVDGTPVDFGRFDFPTAALGQHWAQASGSDDPGGRMAAATLDQLALLGNTLEMENGLPKHLTRRGRHGKPPPEFPPRAVL